MKFGLRSILIISLLLFIYNLSDAIELESYTAKQGYPAALKYVQDQLAFNTPELLAVGTANGEVEIGGTTNKIGFDMANGKSKGWSYAFINRQNGNTAIIGVGKYLGFYQAQDITDQIPEFFPDINSKKLTQDYIDSDELPVLISGNSTYKDYIKSNPNSKPNLVGIKNNYDNQTLKNDYPYWIAYFGENQDFACYTDALTGETKCDIVTSIKKYITVANTFYPNPAYNNIKLNIDDYPTSITIVDIYGNKVFKSDEKKVSFIDLTNMASGAYNLIFEYNDRIETEKLIIKK